MYGEDLAFVHATGFTELADAAARMVIEECTPGVVTDLGCGDGTMAAALSAAGFTVTGLDVSRAMVALASARVPNGRFMVADIATADVPAATVVTATGEALCYACPDEDALRAAVARVAAALPRDGLFLFDLATTGRAPEATHAEAIGRGWRVEARAEEQDHWLTRTIDTWRTVGGDERHEREVHRLRLFDPDVVLAILAAAGFDAERLGGYDDFGFQPGWDGFLARKQ